MRYKKIFYIVDIFLVFGLFCIIYNPPIFMINSMHIIGLISWFVLIFKSGFTKKIMPGFAIKLILWFVFFAAYLFLISILFNHGTLNVFYTHIYFIFDIIPFALLIKQQFEEKQRSYKDLFKLLTITILIQTFIILLAFFYNPFQQFLISRFVAYGYKSVYVSISRYRMYGFSGGLTFATPIFHSFASVVMFYYAIKEKRRIFYLFSILVLFSAIINARTSIIVVIVGVVSLTLFSRLSISKKVMLFFLECAIIGLLFFVVPPIIKSISAETYSWVEDGLQQIKALFMNDTSEGFFNYIFSSEQYPLPKSGLSFLIGTGHNVFGSESQSIYGVSTDVGFINDLWKGGVLYLSVYYLFFVTIFVKMLKKDNYLVSFIGLFALLSYPLLMFKGSIFDMCDITNFIVIVFVTTFDFEFKKGKYVRFRECKSNNCYCALQQ